MSQYDFRDLCTVADKWKMTIGLVREEDGVWVLKVGEPQNGPEPPIEIHFAGVELLDSKANMVLQLLGDEIEKLYAAEEA